MTSISKTGVDDTLAFSTPAKRADKAESEANKRVQAAESNTRRAENELEQNLSYVRDNYQKQLASEEAHHEAILEAQRLKGYRNLKELQRSQTEEISRVRQEGDARLNDLRNYYRDTKYASEMHGTQDLKDLQLNNEQNLEYTRKTGSENLNNLTEDHLKNTAALADQYETKELQLKAEQQRELDRKQIMGHNANEMAESKFQEQFEKMTSKHQNLLKRIESDAGRQIFGIRQDTADKLDTYRTRQNDPFYKMMNLGIQLTENENGFILSFKVPEYEQKNLSVSVKGDNIVILGQRRNEESLDLGNGVTQGTASYQSYHESIPLSWPVDPVRLTKEFNGDTVTIRVPKRNKYAAHEKPHIPAKITNETAQFPTGIQDFFIEKQQGASSRSKDSKGSPGSGPLT
ncbi:MAG: Hsp20/alpha crystallin family protein [Bdellovibrionia bacterium]